MQALELRLQLLAERLNGATKGDTGYRDLIDLSAGHVSRTGLSRINGAVEKVATMKEIFDRRGRQSLAFFHETRMIDEVPPHRK